MDIKTYRGLLRIYDPDLQDRVTFSSNPTTWKIQQLLNWAESLSQVLDKNNLENSNLSVEDKRQLQDLYTFLEFYIERHFIEKQNPVLKFLSNRN